MILYKIFKLINFILITCKCNHDSLLSPITGEVQIHEYDY